MDYLGYQWENQVSVLASRITLHLQKEIKLVFLSSTTVNTIAGYDKEPHEWVIQGFCLSRYSLPREVAEEMVADLDCIYINKYYKSELIFTICAYPNVLQAWYDIMWEGVIATKVINELGGTDGLLRAPKEKRKLLKEQFQKETEKCLV
jgi:hypothetical protein